MSDEIITDQENTVPTEITTPKVAEPVIVAEPEIATEPEVVTSPVVVDEPVTTPIEPAPMENTPEIPIENKTEAVVTPTEVTPEPVPEIKMEEPTPITTTEPINEDKIIRSFLLKILDKAKIATQSRNKKRMETLLTFFDTNSHVTNDMVEKLLKISDSSARNYLNKLDKQGKIIQHGNVGRGVFYTKL